MKLNTLIVTILIIIAICPISGKSQSLKEINNKQISNILAFTEEMKTFNNDNMSIHVFRIGLPSDTISKSGTEEIYNRVLISVSEDGDKPRYKLYELSKLFAVGEFKFEMVDRFTERIEFVHGKFKQRNVSVIEINSKNLTAIQIQ